MLVELLLLVCTVLSAPDCGVQPIAAGDVFSDSAATPASAAAAASGQGEGGVAVLVVPLVAAVEQLLLLSVGAVSAAAAASGCTAGSRISLTSARQPGVQQSARQPGVQQTHGTTNLVGQFAALE